MSVETTVNRREIFKTGAALVVGFYLSEQGCARRAVSPRSEVFKPNAWLRITPDNRITVLTEIPEMGQGTRTASTMMLADELEAEWSTIRVEQAPTIPEIYHNLATGGSAGVTNTWAGMRKAGAQAREMLLAAAAQQWGVEKKECRAESGTILHAPSGRRFHYGELVETASKLPVIKADNAPLKDRKDFRFIGKPIPRVDTPSKVDGSAIFGIDVRVPGMLFAVIARCPHFGGKLISFDATAAKAVSGVRAVFPVPSLPHPECGGDATAGGIAVVADSSWAAIQGRRALKTTWEKGLGGSESTGSLRRLFQEQAKVAPALVPVNQGDALHALAGARSKVEAFYELPFQAHATMEPMNTTVDVRHEHIEVWSPTQIAAETQASIVRLSGLPANKVTVHTTLSGGSFGRRAQWDYPAEAWQVGNEIKRPVQLFRTREDDMQHDYYRQYAYHHLSGCLDDQNNIVAWSHRILSTSIHGYFDYQGRTKTDPRYVAGLELRSADIVPYSAKNIRLEYSPVDSVVPRAWWRAVQEPLNAFATESFVDELAHVAGRDPYEFRIGLLREDRKLRSPWHREDAPQYTRKFRIVLQLAAEKSGWGKALPAGHARGIACYPFAGTYVAQVAEVSAGKDGAVRVHRVVSAVDCGLAVNPDGVRAQIEGGINYALTPVLTGEITIKDGAAQQSNFHDYQVLRIKQAPDIEVHIVPSSEDPAAGVGESGVPPLAPAVTNAVFAATGKRVRRLPIPKIS